MSLPGAKKLSAPQVDQVEDWYEEQPLEPLENMLDPEPAADPREYARPASGWCALDSEPSTEPSKEVAMTITPVQTLKPQKPQVQPSVPTRVLHVAFCVSHRSMSHAGLCLLSVVSCRCPSLMLLCLMLLTACLTACYTDCRTDCHTDCS